MKTLRPFFYLLLAANIVLAILSALPLLGIQLPWAPSGEADRLNHQLTPEKIQPLGADPAKPTPPASAITSSPATEPVAAASNPNNVVCVAVRNLTREGTQQISEQAARQDGGLAVRISGVSPTSYWVNIPPNGGKEAASRRGEDLTKAGIEDYIIVRDSGPNQYAISLGLFRSEEAANRLIEQLKKKNIKTARITVRDNTGNGARAEITGRTEPLEALLKEFLVARKDAERDACAPN